MPGWHWGKLHDHRTSTWSLHGGASAVSGRWQWEVSPVFGWAAQRSPTKTDLGRVEFCLAGSCFYNCTGGFLFFCSSSWPWILEGRAGGPILFKGRPGDPIDGPLHVKIAGGEAGESEELDRHGLSQNLEPQNPRAYDLFFIKLGILGPPQLWDNTIVLSTPHVILLVTNYPKIHMRVFPKNRGLNQPFEWVFSLIKPYVFEVSPLMETHSITHEASFTIYQPYINHIEWASARVPPTPLKRGGGAAGAGWIPPNASKTYQVLRQQGMTDG